MNFQFCFQATMSVLFKNLRRIVSFVFIFLILFQSVSAQDKFNRLNSWADQHLNALGGRAVLIILKDSQIVYNQSFNKMSKRQITAAQTKARLKDLDENTFTQDFSPDTKAEIDGAGKWLTAALAMTFVQENKFRLSDTVGKFLPILSKNGKGHIRIWHCLTNTTGIKEGGLRESLPAFQKIETAKEYVEFISEYPMEAEPGKIFRYGNIGWQLLAAIMEQVGEKDFHTLFKERITEPLQMAQTDFGSKPFPLLGSQAFSSPIDYIQFLQMILQEGRYKDKRIISKALINEMQKNRIGKDCIIADSPDEERIWGYGFGEWLMEQPLATTPRKDAMPESPRSLFISCPGITGSFPWINYQKKYAAILFFTSPDNKENFRSYQELKEIVDSVF
jgi:CubicO group peptidase (beta-lactamase class C family)